MWLNRVWFNVKNRLLNQKSEEETQSRRPSTWIPKAADEQARLIQTRLIDLDQRLDRLQAR